MFITLTPAKAVSGLREEEADAADADRGGDSQVRHRPRAPVKLTIVDVPARAVGTGMWLLLKPPRHAASQFSPTGRKVSTSKIWAIW